MPAASPTSCPACSYELANLFDERHRVTCPECGRRWSRSQVCLLNERRISWGPSGPMLATTPLVAGFVAAFLRLAPITRPGMDAVFEQTSVVTFFWLWIAMGILLTRNSRKRLDDFSPVAGVIAGGILALLLLAVLMVVTMYVWGLLFL